MFSVFDYSPNLRGMGDTYKKRRLVGTCVTCGKVPAAMDRVRCSECLVAENARHEKDKPSRLARGLCRSCCKPNTNGFVHCDVCKSLARDRTREYHRLLKDEVFGAYGGYFCACVGCSWHVGSCVCVDPVVLAIDHINNDGAEHRKSISHDGGDRTYVWLRQNNYPAGFQVLCFNCNWTKLARFRSVDRD